jgi:hypothetical protein
MRAGIKWLMTPLTCHVLHLTHPPNNDRRDTRRVDAMSAAATPIPTSGRLRAEDAFVNASSIPSLRCVKCIAVNSMPFSNACRFHIDHPLLLTSDQGH